MKHRQKNQSEPVDWVLLARYLSSECSAEEKAAVDAWINTDVENERLLKLMQVAWNVPESETQPSDVGKLWHEVAKNAGLAAKTGKQKISQTAKPVSKITRLRFDFQPAVYRALRYAAVLLVATSLIYFLTREAGIFPWGRQAAEINTITVQNADRQRITLSDATVIVLDAGSTLRFPETFSGDQREVTLDGEGYFEVLSNPHKPFIVHASHAVVEVLGTKFNVRAWHLHQTVTVAVEEGHVSLRSRESGKQEAVVVSKGQASTLAENEPPSAPLSIDIKNYLGWMQNEALFTDVPLHEILFQLERWYDVQFELADSAVASERLTMHIKNQSLEDILELISALTDLQYRRSGGSIHLTPEANN